MGANTVTCTGCVSPCSRSRGLPSTRANRGASFGCNAAGSNHRQYKQSGVSDCYKLLVTYSWRLDSYAMYMSLGQGDETVGGLPAWANADSARTPSRHASVFIAHNYRPHHSCHTLFNSKRKHTLLVRTWNKHTSSLYQYVSALLLHCTVWAGSFAVPLIAHRQHI